MTDLGIGVMEPGSAMTMERGFGRMPPMTGESQALVVWWMHRSV